MFSRDVKRDVKSFRFQTLKFFHPNGKFGRCCSKGRCFQSTSKEDVAYFRICFIKTRPSVKFPLYLKKAGLVSRNIVHLRKNHWTLCRLLPLYSSFFKTLFCWRSWCKAVVRPLSEKTARWFGHSRWLRRTVNINNFQKYSLTPFKRPPIKRPSHIRRPSMKVPLVTHDFNSLQPLKPGNWKQQNNEHGNKHKITKNDRAWRVQENNKTK